MTQQDTLLGFDAPPDNRAQLLQKFIIPPFSVLDTRQGYWQERKKLWLSLGIKSELGRGQMLTLNSYEVTQEGLNYDRNLNQRNDVSRKAADGRSNVSSAPQKPEWATGTGTENMAPGTSMFDPLLCELIYKWFCPDSGLILDPFAGGSVRGIVASILGYGYHGIDLSKDQIIANEEQAHSITPDNLPLWYQGDSNKLDEILPHNKQYDLIFSCPPYHNLEQYTDDMDDLSNMSWGTFKERYNHIIAKAILRLKPNRFACFVVSEIRDDNGVYKGLVPYTIDCFMRNGTWYYNEIILINVVGSLPIRISKQFSSSRKIGRTHQNILIFYKGNPDRISYNYKDIESDIGMISLG